MMMTRITARSSVKDNKELEQQKTSSLYHFACADDECTDHSSPSTIAGDQMQDRVHACVELALCLDSNICGNAPRAFAAMTLQYAADALHPLWAHGTPCHGSLSRVEFNALPSYSATGLCPWVTTRRMGSSATFIAAAEALSGLPGVAQRQADSWLSEFKYSPDAWPTILNLLQQQISDDVVFHVANIALSKAKNDWRKLGSDERRHITQVVSDRIFAGKDGSLPKLVLDRLCMAETAMTCMSGAQETSSLLQRCGEMIQHGGPDSTVALTMIYFTAEQISELDSSSRQALAQPVSAIAPHLLQGMSVLLGRLPADQQEAPIKAIGAWLRIGSVSGSSLLTMPPSEFAAACPNGVQQLVAALAAEPTRDDATDSLCTLLSGGHARAATTDAAPLAAVISHLHALAEHAAAGGDAAARSATAPLLTAVARVAAAAVEGEPSLTAAPPLAALLRVLVDELPQRGPTYATAVLEVLFAVNMEAVTDRAEPLRGPLFAAAVQHVLPVAMFPEGYEPGQDMGVADEELEEQDFLRFRRVEVADLLAQTCNLCGFGCIAGLLAPLPQQPSWQMLDVLLLAVRSVVPAVRSRMPGGRLPDAASGATPQQQQEAQAIHAALAQFIGAVLRQHSAVVQGSAQLLATCSQALGDLAFWFSAAAAAASADAPLTEAITLCMSAAVTAGGGGVEPPQVCPEACTALRHLVAANIPAAVMTSPDLVQGITERLKVLCERAPVSGAASDAASDGRTTAAASALAEASARLTLRLPAAAQTAAASALVAAPLSALSAADRTTRPPPVITFSLHTLSAILRFLEVVNMVSDTMATGAANPALAAIEQAWPTVQALASSPLAQNPAISKGLCDVASAALSSAGSQRGSLIAPVLTTLQAAFTAAPDAAPLATLARVVELSGDGACVSPEQRAPLHAALPDFVSAARTACTPPNPPNPDLSAEALTVLSRWLLFHPAAMVKGGFLDSSLGMALEALAATERGVVQAALNLLTLLLTPNPMQRRLSQEDPEADAALASAAQSRADGITRFLLRSACDSCPQDSWRTVGRVLHAMLTTAGVAEPAMRAVEAELLGGPFAAMERTPLVRQDCERFVVLCRASQHIPAPRFMALVKDFAGIAHGLNCSDDLLAYEV
eukprot:jgi/Ulvmu1/7166/UM034_0074.1